MKENFELILATESKVVATNIKLFEEQANIYLSTLTNTFETDDDFATAKEEVKELKEIESKIRTAIDHATKGSADVTALLDVANSIAERFRQERLQREKLVAAKELEVKQSIIQQAFNDILQIRQGFESDVSLALERTMPKLSIENRLKESAKRRSTLATLTKAVNAEAKSIKAEIASESARIAARRKLIPISHEYLFKDCIDLIAGNDDLVAIVKQRIDDENKREAEIKEKSEREAKAKQESEQVQPEKAVVQDKTKQQLVSSTPEMEQPIPTEPLDNFVITIRLNQVTKTQARNLARSIKEQVGDCVSLHKEK